MVQAKAKEQIGRKLAKKRNKSIVPPTLPPPTEARPLTGAEIAKQLVESGAFGAWADRDDIGDSAEYARKLREQAQNRERD